RKSPLCGYLTDAVRKSVHDEPAAGLPSSPLCTDLWMRSSVRWSRLSRGRARRRRRRGTARTIGRRRRAPPLTRTGSPAKDALLDPPLHRFPGLETAEELLFSLEESDDDGAAAWAAELERRSREVAEGHVHTVAWETARAEVVKELQQRRARRTTS